MKSRLIACALVGLTAMWGQTPRPSFEVASVKPHDPHLPARTSAEAAKGSVGVGGRFVLLGVSPLALLMRAFDMQPDQIGGPDWIRTQNFDIFANAPAGAAKEQYPLMFQALLADRFKLQYHLETPMTSVYALVVAPDGPKLAPAIDDPDPDNYGPIAEVLRGAGETRSASARARAIDLGIYRLAMANGMSHYVYENIAIPSFAHWVRNFLDLPVVDLTGLKGRYQITLDVPMGHCAAPRGQPDDQSVPTADDPCADTHMSVLSSLKKQGLMLDKRKAPYAKLVVDHIEKTPTEN